MRKMKESLAARRRAGGIRRRLLIGLVFLGAIGAVAGGLAYSFRGGSDKDVITRRPVVGEFVTEYTERGDVESSSNTELRCEVSSAEGIRILDIIAEGTQVNPGDFVVQLDDSGIKKDLNAQKIALQTVEAACRKAENEYEAAKIALKEYELGTFVQEEQKLEGEQFVAEENSRRAINYFNYSQKLAAMGYITDAQLESDRFQVARFKKDLDSASTKLMVIREFTKAKSVRKFESDIKIAEASANAENAKLAIEKDKLALLESQVEKCLIKAPAAGQVVYHNPDRWRGEEYFIRKGNRVRERQVIVKLPDITKMQVKTKVGEARVDRVKPGMPATIRVEALRGVDLQGTVKSISPYASDENWFNPNSKEYDAIVVLDNPPAGLKPGMTSQCSIRVEKQENVLQLPVQCIVPRADKYYAVVRESARKMALRELKVGSTNDKFTIVKEGIAAEDEVVMNPVPHLARLGLKEEEPDKNSAKPVDESKSKPAAPPVAGGGGNRGAS